MTVENEMYGGGWQKCSNCGVKDRPDELKPHITGAALGFIHLETKAATCAEWKATLAKAKPADIDQAALEQLKVRPVVDLELATGPRFKPVAVTVPRPPPTSAPSDGVDSGHVYGKARK